MGHCSTWVDPGRRLAAAIALLALCCAGCGSIFEAIENGDMADVRQRAQEGELEARNQAGRTPLAQAIAEPNRAIALALIELGADPNATDSSGVTPLHLAARLGDEAIANALLHAGAKVDAGAHSGETPLLWAAREGEIAIVKSLLEAGADPNVVTEDGLTPAKAALHEGYLFTSTYLLLPIDRRDRDAEPIVDFFTAALEKDEKAMAAMLDEGADPNVRDADDDGALVYAYTRPECCAKSIAAMLLDRGYRVQQDDVLYLRDRIEPIVGEGDLRTLRALKAAGWDPDHRSDESETALTAAASAGQLEVVEALLEMGAAPDVLNGEGHTARFLAEDAGHYRLALRLPSDYSKADHAVLRAREQKTSAFAPKEWRPAVVDPPPTPLPAPEPEPTPVCLGGGAPCGSGCCTGTCCKTPWGYECKSAIEGGLFTGCN